MITIDGYFEDKDGRELLVEISFTYYGGYAGSYYEPPEEPEIEIEKLMLKAGKYSYTSTDDKQQYNSTLIVDQDFELDDDWIESDSEEYEYLTQQCWDWIIDERENGEQP